MDIANIFKSKTRRSIFRIYFTNPENRYYLRELERLFRIPVSMIRKELVRLEKDGIFCSEKKGNLIFYFLNKEYPLFDELRSIVFKTIGVQGLIKTTLQNIRGIRTAFLYGSFARNEISITSDVDLCIIGEIDENILIKEIGKLETQLKREINYTLYTNEEFKKKRQIKDSFVKDVLKNPKIILVEKKDDL